MVPIRTVLLCLFCSVIGRLSICSCFSFTHTPSPTSLRDYSCTKWKSPIRCTKRKHSVAPSTKRCKFRNPNFFSITAFSAKRSEREEAKSFLRSLSGSPFKKRKGVIETGAETALVLGNKQQRTQLVKDVSKCFPWIPSSMISGCVGGLASAFAAIAPKDVQKALKPGGLEKVRSKIEAKFVRNLRSQPFIRQLPIAKDDKKKMVEYLVELSLDFFLKDLETVLASPSVKLHELDRERREILKFMSFRQRAWYRLRYKPKASISFGLISLWTFCVTFLFFFPNQYLCLGIQQLLSAFSFLGEGMIRWASNARFHISRVFNS